MQKRIAILVAMDKEYDLLHNMLNIKEVALDEKKENERYVIGTSKLCDEISVMLTKCGIGKVNSALTTASVIKNFHPHIVVSSGVCGCLNKGGVDQGTIFVNLTTKYHDVYCGEALGQVQGMPQIFKAADFSSSFVSYLMGRQFKNVYGCRMMSGDWFVDTAEKAEQIYKEHNLDEEWIYGIDMESGSIAQTCYRYNLPFVGIRIVSDCPLCPECASYDDFWKNAPDTLNKVVCAFFDFVKETQL